MSRLVLLDSGPLGMLAHLKPKNEISQWIQNLTQANVKVIVPEIADYEVRRELLLSGMVKSLTRLDQLKATFDYAPLNTEVMLKAAEFWAETRKRGQPTADRHALDGDVILAAQAFTLANEGYDVIVATMNVKHLKRFVTAKHWKEIE